LKEGERGNKEEVLGGGKGKRPGGLWLNYHLLPPLPPDPEQGMGQAARGPADRGARRRPWPRRRPGDGAKRRGRQGGSIPLPDLSRDGMQGRLGSGGRREVVPAMAAALGRSRGRGMWLLGCEAERGTSLVLLYPRYGGNSAGLRALGAERGVMVEVTVRPSVAAVRGEEGDAAPVGRRRPACVQCRQAGRLVQARGG
jgi:hypothetical protein